MKTNLKLVLLALSVATSLKSQLNTNWLPASTVVIGAGTQPGAGTLDFQFNVRAPGPANNMGWGKAIKIYDQGALYFEGSAWPGAGGGTDRDYFMGYSNNHPTAGRFLQGYSEGPVGVATTTYVSEVYVDLPPPGNPDGTMQIFKNLLVEDNDGTDRRFGVNVQSPVRSAHIFKADEPQLRLSYATNQYTDIESTSLGDLNIQPYNKALLGKVGIHVALPTERLDVNGNARLRSVPTQSANYIMTGVQVSGANDIKFSKTALTGNTCDVFRGDGTFGPSCYSFAQNCSESGDPAKFLNHRQIPMNGYNLYFTGQSFPSTGDAIGLGYYQCDPLPAKLSVYEKGATETSVGTIAGSFINRDKLSPVAPGTLKGVEAICDRLQEGNTTNLAGDFYATSAPVNIGVIGRATGTAATGVKGVASGTTSFGIYGENSGVGTSNQWAGYFRGDVMINGNGYLTGMIPITSDIRFKRNIKELENTTEKISKLKGYSYEFKAEEFKEKNFAKGEQIGFIAQELKEVFPQLVVEGPDGYNYVNYQGMIPVLLQAIKEQQQQLLKQQKDIGELKELVKNAITSGNLSTSVQSIELSNANSVILEQNVPNPFAEQTTITYSLPENVQKAQILFYNAEGKLIKAVDLKTVAGKAQLNIFASDLSNGVYSYSLLIDGKIMETKRMIKSND